MRPGTGRTVIWTLVASVVAVVLLAAGGAWYVTRHGISAREPPSSIEEAIARRLRHLAIPRAARAAKNPITSSPQALAEGRAHFADHCATCHANDGGGRTLINSDEGLVEAMKQRLAENDHRFGTLIDAIVTSPQFMNKRGGGTSQTPLAGE